MSPELLARLSAPVPRYTSYPPANHFSDKIGPLEVTDWLKALTPGAPLSLYVHLPFCHTLCWYCACNTRAVRRYEPITAYLEVLKQEALHVAGIIPRHLVRHAHWGGGSPDSLSADDIRMLGDHLRHHYTWDADAEFAVEIDSRLLDQEQVRAFESIGVNRISLGVQDFEPKVQAAIGREQSFETTARAVEAFRAHGARSVNIDLVYGLPHQTMATALRTIDRVMELAPNRVAIFGYAHLPQRMSNQRLIDTAALPGPMARLALAEGLAAHLVAAGYRQIGIDHFALATDDLAQKPVSRNFQGYTTDAAESLIGLGASSISSLDQGFAQNATGQHDYERRVRETGIGTARGIALSGEDRIRAFVIERLMCEFRVSVRDVLERFGPAAAPVVALMRQVTDDDRLGLVTRTPGGLELTAKGRPFVRTICAAFDAYLPQAQTKYSQAV